jgi:hypothetical protein
MNINASVMTNKFLARMFRKIDGIVWDLSTGNIGVSDAAGIYTINEVVAATRATPAIPATQTTDAVEAVAAAKAEFQVNVNPFEQFGMAVPGFATQVPFERIQLKDIIVGDNGILGWVVDKKAASLTLMTHTGTVKQFVPPKVTIGGGDGVLVVQSLINLAGDGFAGLQGSLLPLLMMGGGDNDSLGDILPMLLFSQTQGAGNNATSAMLPMLMMMKTLKGGEGGSSIDKLLPLMMMGGLGGAGGGAGGMNPMMVAMMMGGDGDLFGGSKTSGIAPVRGAMPQNLPPVRRSLSDSRF